MGVSGWVEVSVHAANSKTEQQIVYFILFIVKLMNDDKVNQFDIT